MSNYHYDVSLSRQKKFIRQFKIFLLASFTILLVTGIIIGFDSYHQSIKGNTGVGQPLLTVVKPSIREFDTAYFSFASPTSWINLPDQTTTQKFTYQGGKGKMLQQRLDIYINNLPKDLYGTRALPIRIDSASNRIIPTEVTEHCNSASTLKKASAPVRVTISEVSMPCQLDSANYIVIVAEKGGDESIKLKRTDGSTVKYYFVYRSSSVPPDTQPLIDIISSFTSK